MLNLEMTQKSIQCHGTGAWGTRITFVPTEITDPRSEHVLLPWCLSPGWHDRPDFLRSRESDKGVMSQDRVSSPQYLSGNLTIGVSAQWSPLTSTPSPTFPLQGKSWVNTFLQAQGPSPPPPPPALTYWGELLPLDILGEGRIKVLRIAFIEAIDAPFLFDLHIPVHQNELSNGLWNRKESGKVRTSPPGLQERVADRVGDKAGLEAWGHTCASVYASVQRAWILCFQLRCNWHNIMLVSGIQHNASIFVYVVKWLPAREILGLRQVCLWEKKKKKDETGARISGEGVHGCSYLSFPVFVSVLMSFSPSTLSLPHV